MGYIELFKRTVAKTQSKYRIVDTSKEGNQQNSYNLSIEVMDTLLEAKAIKNIGNNTYEISDHFKLEIGEGIDALLVENTLYEKVNVVFNYTEASDGTKKFQIKRTENSDGEYKWFSELYDNNYEGSDFLVYLDEGNKLVKFDISLPIELNKGIYDFYLLDKQETKTTEYLGKKLREYYDNKSTKVLGIYLYGVDYSSVIKNNSISVNEIIKISGIGDSYVTELNKAIKLGEELKTRSRDIEYNKKTGRADKEREKAEKIAGSNKLFYGIPGCGKSYKIASMLEYKIEFQEEANKNGITSKVDKDNIFRTTFYLDYSYSDFVGQIYPVVDENGVVSYSPVPGPFTKALTQAYMHPEEMIYLVIEEINRGNAAAIFGDLFQLLDRVKIEEDNKIVGESEYPITNEFIESYFKFVNTGKEKTDPNYVVFEVGNIKIPANMTIFSTMNTSDQNVFPLDTAFKRRWERERVVPDWDTAPTAKLCIPFTNITWKKFATTINARMIQNSEDGIITQDKNMGPYFANESMLSKIEERHINNDDNKDKLIKFMNNVIDYLFLDVTKFNHDVLFAPNETYDSIYNSFAEGFIRKGDIDKAQSFLNLFAEKMEEDIEVQALDNPDNEK